MSNTYRLFPLYSSPEASLPSSFILKLAPLSTASRKAALRYGLSEREVRFYSELRPDLTKLTSISKCYYSAFSPIDGTCTLLISDAGLEAKAGDDLVGATKEQARSAVREIARFHGEILRKKEEFKIEEQAWLKQIPLSRAVLGLMFGGFYQRFYRKDNNTLTEEDWDLARRFVAAFEAWQKTQEKSEREDDRLMGLNHCDFRMDNILFGVNGEVTVVDWQTLNCGPVVSDLAYFLGGSLKTEDRRAWMDELVEVYVEGVNGGKGERIESVLISREDVMRGLKERAWVGVIGSSVGAMIGERTARGDVMLAEMMRRSCIMVRDFEADDDIPKVSGGWNGWLLSIMGICGRMIELMGRWG